MLISNGKVTRNIAPGQLPEYENKGYKEVKKAPKRVGKKTEKDEPEKDAEETAPEGGE